MSTEQPCGENGQTQAPQQAPQQTSLPLRTKADPNPRDHVTLFEALKTEGLTVGMIVQSIAGHDYSRLGIVTELQPPFVLIVDGKYRPVNKPKKKRLSHLRPVAQADPEALSAALQLPEEGQRNSEVRRLIRQTIAPYLITTEPETDQTCPRR